MSTGAGCLCGAVRIAIAADPMTVRTCWCRDCQYWAAGSATVNAVYDVADLAITGTVRWFESDAASGNRMRRGFCAECGTPLFSASATRPQLLIVRAGAHDDPGRMAPQMTIWAGSAPGWAQIDPDLPRFEAQPPPLA